MPILFCNFLVFVDITLKYSFSTSHVKIICMELEQFAQRNINLAFKVHILFTYWFFFFFLSEQFS